MFPVEHLISVEIINISIVPDITGFSVLSFFYAECTALRAEYGNFSLPGVLLGSVIVPVKAEIATVAGEAR